MWRGSDSGHSHWFCGNHCPSCMNRCVLNYGWVVFLPVHALKMNSINPLTGEHWPCCVECGASVSTLDKWQEIIELKCIKNTPVILTFGPDTRYLPHFLKRHTSASSYFLWPLFFSGPNIELRIIASDTQRLYKGTAVLQHLLTQWQWTEKVPIVALENVVILLRETIKKEGRELLGNEGRIENITGQLLCMQIIKKIKK